MHLQHWWQWIGLGSLVGPLDCKSAHAPIHLDIEWYWIFSISLLPSSAAIQKM